MQFRELTYRRGSIRKRIPLNTLVKNYTITYPDGANEVFPHHLPDDHHFASRRT